MRKALARLAISLSSILMLVCPDRGGASSSPHFSRTGQYYSITLETPNIEFEIDPDPEHVAFHREVTRQYAELLERHASHIAAKVELVRRRFGQRIRILEYRPDYPEVDDTRLPPEGRRRKTPCRMSFAIRSPEPGAISLAFGEVPDAKTHEALSKTISALFARDR